MRENPARRALAGLVATVGLVVAGCASPPRSAPVVRPAQGQSPEQQTTDRTACQAWAQAEAARSGRRPRGMYLRFGRDQTAFEDAYARCMARRGYTAE